MKNLKRIDEAVGSINERRASAEALLKSLVKGETDNVEGIELSREMALDFLMWLQYSTYGKKFGALPFYKLFTAAFNWGLDRFIGMGSAGSYRQDKRTLKKEYKELKAKAKKMSKAEMNKESVNEAKFVSSYDTKVNDAETKKDVSKIYPKAEFFVGKLSHFFGELEPNLFFKAYYAKYYKEDTGKSIKGDFKITSVYSKKGSKYVELLKESEVNEAAPKMKQNKDAEYLQELMNQVANAQKGGMASRYGKDFDKAKTKALRAIKDMVMYSKIGI